MDQEIINSYTRLNDLNVSRETFLDFENYISLILEKNKKIKVKHKSFSKRYFRNKKYRNRNYNV